MLVEANVKRNYRMKQIGFTRYLAGRHGQHKDSHKDSSVLGSLSPPMDDARVLGYSFGFWFVLSFALRGPSSFVIGTYPLSGLCEMGCE